MPRLCFTCETPIKFAFFCSKSFIIGKRDAQSQNKGSARKSYSEEEEEEDFRAICLIGRKYHITIKLYILLLVIFIHLII